MKVKPFKPLEKQQSFYSEPKLSLQDSFRYHALCARLTLYPNKTIEEAQEIIEDTISKWNKQ